MSPSESEVSARLAGGARTNHLQSNQSMSRVESAKDDGEQHMNEDLLISDI